ncbi:hypothetical protein SAMN05216582_1296 [Selenomonas ruminantium]|uniref:Uncharacterized protein n=1 Tax=Selenomonas ruminantium TaxID=971 RepID=A0A1M6WXW9_SELRU|nr:hypothetical protein [Selenomonas ruminantium]SHK98524.1 hypothetical protein SAMN05216582_1296 [Selenomonas ruminantium]
MILVGFQQESEGLMSYMTDKNIGALRDMDTTSIVLPYGSDGASLPEQKQEMY